MTPYFLLIQLSSLKRILLSFIFVSVAVLSFGLPAFSSVFDDTLDEIATSPGSATFETGFIYDDNVFQEKETPTSDVIWESSLFLGYERGDVFLSALAITNRYRDHSFLNYSFYEIGIEGLLGKGNTGRLFLNLSPTAALDKADVGLPFELESRGFDFILDHEMSWGSVGFSFSVTRLIYNAPFEAKNSDVTAFGPSFYYFFSEAWTVFGEAAFERGRAAGGFIGRRPDDISYRAAVLSLQSRYTVSPRVNARLRYHLRRKRFTTELDVIHRGRVDLSQLVGFYIEAEFFSGLSFRVGAEKNWLISRKTPRVEFEAQRWLFSVAYAF